MNITTHLCTYEIHAVGTQTHLAPTLMELLTMGKLSAANRRIVNVMSLGVYWLPPATRIWRSGVGGLEDRRPVPSVK